MKSKLFALLAVIALVMTGCDEETSKQTYVYQKGFYYGTSVNYDHGHMIGNTLLSELKEGVNVLNQQFAKELTSEADDEAMLADFDQAVAALNKAKQAFDEKVNSGNDFGDNWFERTVYFVVLKNGEVLNSSREIEFNYFTNERILLSDTIKVDTQYNMSTSGTENVRIDNGAFLNCGEYRLFQGDGTLVDQQHEVISEVELQMLDGSDEAQFVVTYNFNKGELPGYLYLLVTVDDGEDVYDVQIPICHKTVQADF